MIIYYLLIGTFFVSTLIFVYKYFKLRKNIKDFKDIGTGRYGFYKRSAKTPTVYDAIIYVKEIDRYTDGYSKIILGEIEPCNTENERISKQRAQDEFVSLKLTSEIEWLESEDLLKKHRKEKLEKLKKI